MRKSQLGFQPIIADCSYGPCSIAVLLVVLAIWGEGLIFNTFGVTGQVLFFNCLPFISFGVGLVEQIRRYNRSPLVTAAVILLLLVAYLDCGHRRTKGNMASHSIAVPAVRSVTA
jgi:hypothetical protein